MLTWWVKKPNMFDLLYICFCWFSNDAVSPDVCIWILPCQLKKMNRVNVELGIQSKTGPFKYFCGLCSYISLWCSFHFARIMCSLVENVSVVPCWGFLHLLSNIFLMPSLTITASVASPIVLNTVQIFPRHVLEGQFSQVLTISLHPTQFLWPLEACILSADAFI